MKLVYYKRDVPNFGDDLNGVLWPALAPELFSDPKPQDDGFVGIGTIIGMDPGPTRRLHVFSSGIGNDPVDNWRDLDVTYWCVRGPISAQTLGLEPSRALSDGALLTPFVEGFPKTATGEGGVLVIPHFQSITHGGWEKACALAGFELVDPRGSPREIVARIASAKVVLTESLHGAVFADLYGVPWHAFAPSRHFGVTKWVDWLAGLGRDLELTLVPAPDPRLVFAYGRRNEPLGSRLRFTVDQAMEELDARIAPDVKPSAPKAALKRLGAQVPGLTGALLGFTPERTAEALTRLAVQGMEPTPRALIERLQEQMMERFGAFREAASSARRP